MAEFIVAATFDDVVSTMKDVVAAIGEMRLDVKDLKTLFDPKMCAERNILPTDTGNGLESSLDTQAELGDPPPMQTARHKRSSATATGSGDERSWFVASTLPLGWPTSLVGRKSKTQGLDLTLDPYNTSQTPGQANKLRPGSSGDDILINSMSSRYVESGQASQLHYVRSAVHKVDRRCKAMITPFSHRNQMFEMLGLVMLLIDSIVIPYSVSFQNANLIVDAHSISLVYWSIHILKSFTTGYFSKQGDIVMGSLKVIQNYLKTWFLLDSIMLALDCWSMYLAFTDSFVSFFFLLTILRGSRLNVIARVTNRFFETTSLFDGCDDFIRNHVPGTVVFLAKKLWLLFSFVYASHILCCLWYGIGAFAPADTGIRWTEVASIGAGVNVQYFLQMSEVYQYSVCFLWGVSQITLAGSALVPQNTLELFVSSGCIVLGFLLGSTLVSLLSASMVDYQMLRKDETQKLRMLRQYLRENRVVEKVAINITTQVTQRLARRERLIEKDVHVLKVLSSPTLRELRCAVRRPHLERHALFRLSISLDSKLFQHICSTAVDMAVLSQADDIFLAGHEADGMYYLITGRATYFQESKTSPVAEETRAVVLHGTWLAEAVLWSEWIHVGTAQTEEGCCFLKVAPLELFELVQRNWLLYSIFQVYAESFHKHLRSAKPPRASWPTDLNVPFCDYCDLVVSMPKHLQIVIGLDALRHMPVEPKKLRAEVESAKSLVVVNGNGDIFRVVSLVAIQVFRSGGEWFAQVGKSEGNKISASCQLPGGKIEGDETPSDAMERILKSKLPLLENKVQFTQSTRTDTEKDSKEYGVRTRYFRTTFAMELLHGERLHAPLCPVRAAPTRDPDVEGPRNPRRREVVARHSASELNPSNLNLRMKSVVCVFKNNNPSSTDAALYAWLSPEDFDYLSSAVGEEFLNTWLEAIELPEKGDVLSNEMGADPSASDVSSNYSSSAAEEEFVEVKSEPMRIQEEPSVKSILV